MAKRITQFGTSRFLQAHVDLFVHEARESGQDIGPITVVKTTIGGPRDSRIEALRNPVGFPIRIRGYDNGLVVDKTTMVTSVSRALDANKDWRTLVHLFINETDIVISNVGDEGYQIPDEARVPPPPDTVPSGYPAKLLALLIQRFENGGHSLLLLPCELVSNNGHVLRHLLIDLARTWGTSGEFIDWMKRSVLFCDTLVDRIVSKSIEPIGAETEPYALWVIQHEPLFEPPFQHPKVIYTDTLEPFLRLKLHILNLGHTVLADIWYEEKRNHNETVREILSDSAIKQQLMNLYHDEVIPGFAAYGMTEAAIPYVATTLERFENPFLDHRLSDIFQNHAIKVERRINDFVAWVRKRDTSMQFPRLSAIGSR